MEKSAKSDCIVIIWFTGAVWLSLSVNERFCRKAGRIPPPKTDRLEGGRPKDSRDGFVENLVPTMAGFGTGSPSSGFSGADAPYVAGHTRSR